MDKEKQIEEMAKVIARVDIEGELEGTCCRMNNDQATTMACALTAKGYRKASDLAREIFEEIEKMLKGNEAVCENKRLADIGNWIFHEYLPSQFAELKKKYTEGNNDAK